MSKANENLIMNPFNALFFEIFAALVLLLIIVSILLRKKDVKIKKTVVVAASLITLAGFFVYKYYLSIDPEFDALRASIGMGGFNWWGELPLQLCNINLILIPIAVLSGRSELLGFCFFVGPLGALMALTMPGVEFSGVSILIPRMLGYYGTHFMVVILGLSIVTLGLYKPKFRDLPKIALAVICIAFVVFLFNMILRVTGVYPKANYFFSVETEGNFLLEIFRGWIPITFLYLLPAIGILLIYMTPITLGFHIADRIKGKDQKEN